MEPPDLQRGATKSSASAPPDTSSGNLRRYDSVHELFDKTIKRLDLQGDEITFRVSAGEKDIHKLLERIGNIFTHTGGYKTGKWVTHVATLGLNRLRRINVFPGEVGMTLALGSNTIFQLLPGQHYLRPLVYSSTQTLTLPTGLENQPFVSFLGRVHVVKVRAGDVALVTVNGKQSVLGEGFHYFEARRFTFNRKYFIAKTNFIKHGNQCRVNVPRGKLFKAIVDQEPVLLPHQENGLPYLFNTPRFQLPQSRSPEDCFVDVSEQSIEHRAVKVFLVPKGFRVFGMYRGDPWVFEHRKMPYVINDPLFKWGKGSFLSSRVALSLPYVGLLGIHYIRVPKGQLLLVMINGRVSAIKHDKSLGDVPLIKNEPNLQPIAFVATAQRFVSCATWNRVLVRCGEVCLAWHKNKAVRLEARAEPHIIENDDCFRLRRVEEEGNDSTIVRPARLPSSGLQASKKMFKSSSSMTALLSVVRLTTLATEVPSLLSMDNSVGVAITPGVGWRILDDVPVAFKQLCENYHHGPYVQKTVPPGTWGIARINARVHAFLDRFTDEDAGDFRMIGMLPAVEQLIELAVKDVRAADHRLNIKVDFIFKIVDAQKALRSLIPVDSIDKWKGLMEERAKSVVTALLPRVQSNLTIRNLNFSQPEADDADLATGGSKGGIKTRGDTSHGTFAENFIREVRGSWGQTYINKAFNNNGIVLVSFTPSEVHLTDAKTKLRLEESAREASLQEMEVQKIQKSFEAKAAKISTDMELQKMQQRLELMSIENDQKLQLQRLEMQQKLQEEQATLALKKAEAESSQSKIRADAVAYASEKSKASGAFTAQQLELEKLKVVSNCFSNIQYTGPRMMQQQQMLVASMLRNMGMPELMPSMQTASTGGVSAMTVVGSEPGMGSTKVE